jgi:hypothetical protein
MRNSVLIGSLLFLLPAAAIGHDAWIAYNRPELGDIVHAFRLTDLGWVWMHYSKDSYDWARENFSEGFLNGFMDPVLSQKTVLLAALPLIVFLIVKAVTTVSSKMRMLAVMGSTGARGKDAPSLDKKSERFKYKRR